MAHLRVGEVAFTTGVVTPEYRPVSVHTFPDQDGRLKLSPDR
jgi:hypothetical protein